MYSPAVYGIVALRCAFITTIEGFCFEVVRMLDNNNRNGNNGQRKQYADDEAENGGKRYFAIAGLYVMIVWS